MVKKGKNDNLCLISTKSDRFIDRRVKNMCLRVRPFKGLIRSICCRLFSSGNSFFVCSPFCKSFPWYSSTSLENALSILNRRGKYHCILNLLKKSVSRPLAVVDICKTFFIFRYGQLLRR